MRFLLLCIFILTTSCWGFSANAGFTGQPFLRTGVQPTQSHVQAQFATPSEKFPYHAGLDENYTLYWKFNDSHITFETHVKTKGYVGFGISPNGGMKGSDIVIGWVKDGQTHFSDRHAEGKWLPAVDDNQDWHLIRGTESDGITVLKMVRKLDTCDPQDTPIQSGTTKVIFSYHFNDPTFDNDIEYHSRRGTKSLLLLEPPTSDKDSQPLPAGFTTLDFVNVNYSVPATDTTYRCTIWKMPDLKEKKHHMIRYEPIIQRGSEALVHHMILYYCGEKIDERFVGTEVPCFPKSSEKGVPECPFVLVAWGIGGQAVNYPPHVGHSFGTDKDPSYFRLEMHYDNPKKHSGYVDNSGIRLFLTTQLREHDAGVLMTGIDALQKLIIPPENPRFLCSGYCHFGCTYAALKDKPIHVVGGILHAHLLGRKLRTRHIRNGRELPPILEDNNYDFNYQEMRMLKKEITLKGSDGLITECEYDSTDRRNITYGGQSTTEEMCLTFLLYYPRVPFDLCLSSIRYERNISLQRDWTDPSALMNFKKDIEKSELLNICDGNGADVKSNFLTPTPDITKPYDPPQAMSCDP